MEQKSTVQIGKTQLEVHSEVMLDPELMVVTRVLDAAGQQLKKRHLAVPAAAAADFRERGPRALALFLHSSHLCFVQRLLWAPQPERSGSAPPPRLGVLATQVLAPNGQVLRSMGEDQVSGNWLQVSYLMVGLTEMVSRELNLGDARWTVARGEGIAAVILKDEYDDTKVCYVDPDEISTSSDSSLVAHMEAV